MTNPNKEKHTHKKGDICSCGFGHHAGVSTKPQPVSWRDRFRTYYCLSTIIPEVESQNEIENFISQEINRAVEEERKGDYL